LRIADHGPAELRFEGLPRAVLLEPGVACTLNYRLRAQKRGRFTLSRCQVQLGSPLGLWQQYRLVTAIGATRVYPNYAGLAAGQPCPPKHLLEGPRVGLLPSRGAGADFQQLRIFRDGDSLAEAHWQASARQRRPVVREYQQEGDQQIILLLDCGLHMRGLDDGLAYFDHALNAGLLLCQVALRHGDAMGLATFASEPSCYLPPRKGQQQFKALLETMADLHTGQRPGNFLEAAHELLKHQTRRALVVLVSNVRREDDEQLLLAVRLLRRHHRVLVASLGETPRDAMRGLPVGTRQSALEYCGAIDRLNAREALQQRLADLGVALLDAPPGQLGAGLVAQYLSWKKTGSR
jgi:uncharacterized protein (DUF58 family)